MSFADALLGIVVGNAGTILRTTTGGEDNAGVSLPAPGGRSGPSLGEGRSTPTLETAPAGPFRGRAEFRCVLPRPSFTSLKVFSFSGREVAVLLNGMMPEGEHVVSWDASNLPSGVYFSRLEASGCTSTRRLILVK